MSEPFNKLREHNVRRKRVIMTVLGAVVFGGFLALGVLWLLVTAPDSDVDGAWNQSRLTERSDSVSAASNSWAVINSSQG
jgi:hypothetical protein